eukprot:15447031-Alexandrium_andersonii.AAC.1
MATRNANYHQRALRHNCPRVAKAQAGRQAWLGTNTPCDRPRRRRYVKQQHAQTRALHPRLLAATVATSFCCMDIAVTRAPGLSGRSARNDPAMVGVGR